MTRRLPFLLWLVVVWVALWGQLSWANVLGGLAVGSALLVAFPDAGPGPMGPVRPVKALRFLGYFLRKLIEANLIVAWEVVTPGLARVNQAIVAVPIRGASDAVVTLVGNAISLTPGTLTLEVRRQPATLYVHVLHLRSVAETRREIQHLEQLALDAFASQEAIDAARRIRVTDEGLLEGENRIVTTYRSRDTDHEESGP